MDILLIAPITDTHYTVPPIGLGYLGSALRKQGFDVAILDCVKEGFDFDGFRKHIATLDFKVAGFQVFSCDLHSVNKSIGIVKETRPGSTIIVGGAHPTCVGGEVYVDMPGIDFAMAGEAENSFPVLLSAIIGNESTPFENIPGLIWKENGTIRTNERIFIKDLDSLDFPAWDLLKPDTYPENPQGAFFKNFPVAPIITSRGCPFPCTFCASGVMMGRKLRLRSVDNVINEIQLLYNDYNIMEFHILDDNFTFYPDRVKEFCNKIKASGMKFSLSFPNGVRLDTLDRELLGMLKDIGVYAFTVGIESGSPRILEAMKKKLTLEVIEEKVSLIRESGIEPSGFFIVGFPGETVKDIKETIRFAKKLNIKRAHFSNFLPLPGTQETEKLRNRGELGKVDWNSLFYSRVAYCPEGMTPGQLKKLQQKAFLGFYLRPKILFKMLSEIRSLYHLRTIFKRAKDYLFEKK